ASLRPAEWPSLSSELYAAGPAVYQPGFYRLADGREWSRELVEAARPLDEEAQRLVAEVQRAYAQWQSEQQALNRYLQQKEGRRGGEETSTPKRGPSGPEGGGDTGRGGGRGGERDTSSDQSREDRILAARERAVQEARERYEAAKESA